MKAKSLSQTTCELEENHGFSKAADLIKDYVRNQKTKATGPPTQATGPPRSGAGVGVGMLRGAGHSLT